MTWQPHLERTVKATSLTVSTLRSAHSHESAHEVTLAGRTLRVLPDGHTSAKKRSYTITEVATATVMLSEEQILCQLVGALVMSGATALELDGQALMPASDRRGQWRVVLNDDGTVAAAYLGEPS